MTATNVMQDILHAQVFEAEIRFTEENKFRNIGDFCISMFMQLMFRKFSVSSMPFKTCSDCNGGLELYN